MKKLTIFCCTHFYNKNIEKFSNLIPAGTGSTIYPKNWFTDNSKKNISHLNKTYAELTFHYWIWKNYLDQFGKNDFFGFSQYRRFWLKKNHDKNIDYSNLGNNLLREYDEDFNNVDAILTKPVKVDLKFKSVLKYRSLINNIKNPKPIFSKEHQTVGIQFEVYTKSKNFIYEVAEKLDKSDKYDFIDFLKKNNQINLHNMFITKKIFFNNYMEYLFRWFESSEQIISRYNSGGTIKMHALIAERFLPFWFNKYCNILELPWIFCDTSKVDENKTYRI